jgi:hypothetical protein
MGKPEMFMILKTRAIWFGVSWAKSIDGFEFNINIPFRTFSFYKELTSNQK